MFTRVGPIHVSPPSFDVKKKTSTFELVRWPLRLSSRTRYRSSANSPPRRSATMLPYELTRKHEFVSTLRPPWPRAVQSWRFWPERGQLTSKTTETKNGPSNVSPPSRERTTRYWFSSGVLKFSNATHSSPVVGFTVGVDAWL